MSSSLWDVKPIEIPGVHYDDPCHERWNKGAKTGTDVQVWSQNFFSKYSWNDLKGFLTLMEVDGSAGRRFSRYWKSNTKVFIKVMEFQAISQTGMYTLWFIVVSTKWYDHRWQSISSTFFRTLKENMDLKRWYFLTTPGFQRLKWHCTLNCLYTAFTVYTVYAVYTVNTGYAAKAVYIAFNIYIASTAHTAYTI